MKVYEQRGIVTVAGGSTNQVTLNNVGGLLRYLLIQAMTSKATSFQATLVDYKGIDRKRYGFHTAELVDDQLTMPVSGAYTVNILNANATETFYVVFGVQES